jgi:protein SCO1
VPRPPGRLLLLVVLVLLTSCTKVDDTATSNAIVVGGDDDGFHGAALGDYAYDVPDLTLTDTAGKRYSLASTPDTALTLVFFGYTHCPDICQIQMATIASALQRLDDDQRAEVGVAFVTTDPARDTEAVLRDYLDQFDPGFEGLTGDIETIKQVAEPLGVSIEKETALPDGGYEVSHSTPIVVVDDQARAPLVWTQGTSSADIADDVEQLLAGATS